MSVAANKIVELPISDFCETGSGGTPSRSKADRYYGGSIAWVKSGELRETVITETEETITEEGLRESAAKLLPSNTLLVALYGATVGRIGILGIEAATNQAVCHIIPNKERADRRYLYYALRSKVPLWLSKRVGGGQPNISQKIIKDTTIPLPPLAEQKRIAAILDAADNLRAKRREAIAQLDSLLQSTFLDMFGDPVTNPMGWEVVRVGEVTEMGTGSTPSRNSMRYFDGKIPWVKSTEVDWKEITTTSEFVSIEARQAARLKLYPKGSVILALYGQGKTRGKCAILGMDATINQACCAMVPKEGCLSQFLFTFLKFSYLRLRGESRGGNQENLNMAIVRAFPIPLPPLTLQQKFATIVESVERQKARMRAHLAELDALFASLQSRAFNGEL